MSTASPAAQSASVSKAMDPNDMLPPDQPVQLLDDQGVLHEVEGFPLDLVQDTLVVKQLDRLIRREHVGGLQRSGPAG